MNRSTMMCLVVTAMTAAGSAVAQADWTETFGGSNPALAGSASTQFDQAAWAFAGASALGGATSPSVYITASNHLRMEDTTPVGSGGSALISGLMLGESLGDVSVGALLNMERDPSLDTQIMGVQARADGAGHFYQGVIDFSGTPTLTLDRLDGASGFSNLANTIIANFDASQDYYVTLDVYTSGGTDVHLTARLYDSIGGSLITTTSYVDTSGQALLSAGYAGIVAVADTANALGASYDDVSATAIPEPTSLALLGLSALLLRRPSGRS